MTAGSTHRHHWHMNLDALNDQAARRMLAEVLLPYTVVEAVYVPSGTAPTWAAQYAGRRTQWLVDGDIEHMTPWPLPTEPARWVPIDQRI